MPLLLFIKKAADGDSEQKAAPGSGPSEEPARPFSSILHSPFAVHRLSEQETALFPEVLDALLQPLLRGTGIRGKTRKAEKLGRAAVDHLLVNADLIEGERSSAFFAHGLLDRLHPDYFSTSVPRRIRQSCALMPVVK